MPEQKTVYRYKNSRFKVPVADYTGAPYTAARMAIISRVVLKYIPTAGAAPEYADSANPLHSDVFDLATYAEDGEMVIDLGPLAITAGHDDSVEIAITDPDNPDGYVIGKFDILVSDEFEETGDLIPISRLSYLPPLAVTDNYQVLVSDFSRQSIRVNALTLKTMTMPVMTESLDGSQIVFEIVGAGDVDIIRKTGTTTTFAGVTHSKLTGTTQYSSIRLRYNYALNAFIIQDGTGSWAGGSV